MVVMESRRRIGFDTVAAQANVVNEGAGPIEEASNGPDPRNDGQNKSRPDSVRREGVLVYTVDVSVDTGRLPIRAGNQTTNSYTDESPFLTVGDSITVQGYRITLVSDDGITHTIDITDTGDAIPDPAVAIWPWERIVYNDLTLNITFTEPVTGFEVDDIQVANGTVIGFISGPVVGNYTVIMAPEVDGEVIVSIGAGAAHDAYGQPSEASEPLIVESAVEGRPTVTLTSGAPPIVTDRLDVNITFSTPVTGLDADDIVVINGTVESLTGSGANYRAKIIPGGDISGRHRIHRRTSGSRCLWSAQYCVQPDLQKAHR